jgi:hypothetical protein
MYTVEHSTVIELRLRRYCFSYMVYELEIWISCWSYLGKIEG